MTKLAEMTEKYKAEHGYVESAREERDQIAKTCDLLRAELSRVRGLLQRQSELAGQIVYLSKGIYGRDKIALLASQIVAGTESADIGKLDRVKEKMCKDCLDLCATCSRRFKEPPTHDCAGCSFKCCGFCAGSAETGGEKAADKCRCTDPECSHCYCC